MRLENFQGVKHLELTFDGKSARIYGDNETGKTTVFNAFTYLFFDKSSTGAKNFTPKTRTGDGEAHHLDHKVTVTVLNDSKRVTLSKTYKEIYTKKRGSTREEFTGHTTDYSVNGVPSNKREFDQVVEELCGNSDIAKMLTIPHFFAESIGWQERRIVLLDMFGDVNNDEVIASNAQLADLPEVLGQHSVDDFRKIAAARRSEINKELNLIPARIDEANKAIGMLPEESLETLRNEIMQLESKRDEYLVQMAAGTIVNPEIAELEEQIGSLREQRQIALEELNRLKSKLLRARSNKVDAAESVLRTAKSEKYRLEELESRLSREVKEKQELRNRLIQEIVKVQDEQFDELSTVCTSCKRPYEADKIDEMRRNFNENKSRQIEELNERGKREASKEMLEKATEKLAEVASLLEEQRAVCETIEKEFNRTVEADVTGDTDTDQIAITERIRNLDESIGKINDRIETLKIDDRESSKQALFAIQERIDEITLRVTACNQKIGLFTQAEMLKSRIAELEDKERQLGAEYESIDRGLYLCEEFIKAKVSMLDRRINDRFTTVRFRLFQEQINGGIKEDCEVMVPSASGNLVPYPFANNAARINAGLEIIDALAEYYGVDLPVFVDNAESVTKILERSGQMIELIVSEPDKSLRVDVKQ